MADAPYTRGPGPRTTRGPLLSAYLATAALTRDCPNCDQPHGQYCIHKGTEIPRRTPCSQRRGALKTDHDGQR